jgi:hypothetical protein
VTPELIQRDPRTACSPAARASGWPPKWSAIRPWRSPGLLVEKIGGPSVKPYQPAGLWKELRRPRLPAGHRREPLPPQPLHVLEARFAAAFMMTFDAAGRETCVVRENAHQHPAPGAEPDERRDLRRGRASWPPASCAKAAAPETRIDFGFRLATSRQTQGRRALGDPGRQLPLPPDSY